MRHDVMLVIRSDLVKRIDGIAAARGRIDLAALCEQVDTIRRIAHVHGLDAVEGLASLLESAVAYHGHGPVVLDYLDLMRDAAATPSQTAEVREQYAGVVALRMGA